MFASKAALPHRAKFPFDTSNSGSMNFMFAYAFQSIVFLYLIQGITFVDFIGICTINECFLHIKVLAHKFSQLRQIPNDKRDARTPKTVLEYQQLIACVKQHEDIFEYVIVTFITYQSTLICWFTTNNNHTEWLKTWIRCIGPCLLCKSCRALWLFA